MNNFTDRECEVMRLVMQDSKIWNTAVIENDENKTEFQKEILDVWQKLFNIEK